MTNAIKEDQKSAVVKVQIDEEKGERARQNDQEKRREFVKKCEEAY